MLGRWLFWASHHLYLTSLDGVLQASEVLFLFILFFFSYSTDFIISIDLSSRLLIFCFQFKSVFKTLYLFFSIINIVQLQNFYLVLLK